MNSVVILGSTGSIGTQSLDVARKSPDIKILGLSAHKNIDLLEAQAREFLPKMVCVTDEAKAAELKIRLADTPVEVIGGEEGLCELAQLKEANTVLTSLMGIAGLRPTICAIKAKKNIALANKETLVAAGSLVTRLAKENGVALLPVDSEHSAIFQSIQGMADKSELSKIILTASGGPFFGKTLSELKDVTPERALKHPNWNMGQKITIDSATMVNKGLEVIEAKWLFDVEREDIEVLVHPQSIIHSMVEFVDKGVIAQLGLPDMRLPIAYALHYPNRLLMDTPRLDLAKLASLTFAKPDNETFYALPLAYKALKMGGCATAVFNGADEAAVQLFLDKKIGFTDISSVIASALDAYNNSDASSLEDIFNADLWAREYVKKCADNL